MRKTIGILVLLAATGCSGSAPGAPSEEVLAGKLIHGLEDKLKMGGGSVTVELLKDSPASFKIGSPVSGKGGTITVTKLSKCKYQSYADFSGMGGGIGKFTVDLTGLLVDGYPNAQPQGGQLRQLKGASVSCEAVSTGNLDNAQAGGNMCALTQNPETVPAVANISGADFGTLATAFKQEFCK
ncbi:hypothetical protein EN866_19450 [Mesorhizobium sp. M2D.F.Ca.ET.223.01.1.1]|uniref:hypothetical protein n=1 Tax=unclassified Mesorhizobium TaxID=325217 RepID=UPI000FCAC76E|nr:MULTISPECIES: hypothetical protein [unclassified Mesorhizobium]TGP89337.1 hypothetical protein EN864_19460 [bacterium M00.F.Ca.ET.221.01.1.1]TGP94710.1 hypothetical protein EN865_15330 [bacterium M00.F.Ca.ET.222.01.1.1]RVD58876.1 hypothetical protein EN783_14665 [Mesorhizobium sp. M2D.F.Ca.ET.140.01.1.1]TGP27905.1 hypothetical protein EN875_033150 [Mesorhizobium sp. M2D.F.Ca.ET.232.01.1.1]TGP75878.1 hypothetical protein EN867_15330 [Mesorhizobium sp. M2D.F.Ca.ET.224.01.1.1]